jgi:hypothetical protein
MKSHLQPVPDYKRLSQTPHSKSERILTEQIRRGSGYKNIRMTGHRPAIPLLQSRRLNFPSRVGQEGSTNVNARPLAIPETPSQYPFANARHVTSQYAVPRQFVNRADGPLTQRQSGRLSTSLLKDQYNKTTQDEIKQLLELSTGVGQQVLAAIQARQQPQQPSSTPPSATSVPVHASVEAAESKQQAEEVQEFEITTPSKRKLLKQSRSDLKSLQDTYPSLSKDDQRELLRKLRETYSAKSNTSSSVLKGIISSYVETLQST